MTARARPQTALRVRGLVAAAGHSSRMGRPKALLPVADRPLAIHLATIFLNGGADDVVITIPPPPDGAAVAAALAPHLAAINRERTRVTLTENEDWDAGLIGSIRTALRFPTDDVDVVVFSPVDAPFATEDLVAALLVAASADNVDAAAPYVDDKRGHPVAINRSLFAALTEPAPDGARGVLADACVADVAWHDANVCKNVNTPQAWTEAEANFATILSSSALKRL